jgi:prepilin-type N-terminal cleavage/methylation domain-containing protein
MVKKRRAGFTLIELLVVIALMAILVGGIGLSFGGGGTGKAIEASQRIAIGMLSNARNQAIMNGSRARLIIHADQSDPENYLRLLGVIYEDSANPDMWLATGSGEMFPANIRFVPNYGSSNFSHNGREGNLDTMNLNFPQKKAQKAGGGTLFYYYEFKSSGITSNNLAAFIIGEGTYNPGSTESDKIVWNKTSLNGFKILKTGGTLPYPSPDLIKGYEVDDK